MLIARRNRADSEGRNNNDEDHDCSITGCRDQLSELGVFAGLQACSM